MSWEFISGSGAGGSGGGGSSSLPTITSIAAGQTATVDFLQDVSALSRDYTIYIKKNDTIQSYNLKLVKTNGESNFITYSIVGEDIAHTTIGYIEDSKMKIRITNNENTTITVYLIRS